MDLVRTSSFLLILFALASGQSEVESPDETEPLDELKPLPIKAELDIPPEIMPVPQIMPAVEPVKPEDEVKYIEPKKPMIPDLPDSHFSPEDNVDQSMEPQPTKFTTLKTRDPEESDSSDDKFLDYDQYPNVEPLYAENPPAKEQQPMMMTPISSPPMQNDEMNGPNLEMYESANERSPQMGDQDLLSALEIGVCGEITCRTPFKERVRSWMCEYTKYTVELITWIRGFETWWQGCEEFDMEGLGVWLNSVQCPDNSLVKCVKANKRICADDRMGCTRCICKDGWYTNSAVLLKMWQKEVGQFKKRFETYKSKVSMCTRKQTYDECPAEDTSDESGSGDDTIVDDNRDVDSGSGEQSGDEPGSGMQNDVKNGGESTTASTITSTFDESSDRQNPTEPTGSGDMDESGYGSVTETEGTDVSGHKETTTASVPLKSTSPQVSTSVSWPGGETEGQSTNGQGTGGPFPTKAPSQGPVTESNSSTDSPSTA